MEEDQVLITGGGSKNEYLISVITQSSTAKFSIPEEVIVDFKEALIFGFLGVLRLENEVNCLASVTGCKYDHCSGNIFYPNIWAKRFTFLYFSLQTNLNLWNPLLFPFLYWDI